MIVFVIFHVFISGLFSEKQLKFIEQVANHCTSETLVAVADGLRLRSLIKKILGSYLSFNTCSQTSLISLAYCLSLFRNVSGITFFCSRYRQSFDAT